MKTFFLVLILPISCFAQLGNPAFVADLISKVPLPPGFDAIDFGLTVYRTDSGFITDFDPTTKKVTGTAIYVDGTSGNDGNSGADWAHAKKSVATVVAGMTANSEIYVTPGWYPATASFRNTTPGYDFSVICLTNRAVMGVDEVGSWTLESGTTYQYTSATTPLWALDRAQTNQFGDYVPLWVTNSVAGVNGTPGYCYVSANTIYVNLIGGREPDDDVRVLLNIAGHRIGIRSAYFQNLDFVGGSTYAMHGSAATNKDACFNSCSFGYVYSGNCFYGLRDSPTTYWLVNCVARYSRVQDGFNYHKTTTAGANIVEINCFGRYNGLQDTVTKANNGSTAHDGTHIVRINSSAEYNQNRNFHDISNGTQSWFLGCSAGHAIDQAAANDSADFMTGIEGSPSAWFDSCQSTGGSLTPFAVLVGATGYFHRTTSGAGSVLTGTINSY